MPSDCHLNANWTYRAKKMGPKILPSFFQHPTPLRGEKGGGGGEAPGPMDAPSNDHPLNDHPSDSQCPRSIALPSTSCINIHSHAYIYSALRPSTFASQDDIRVNCPSLWKSCGKPRNCDSRVKIVASSAMGRTGRWPPTQTIKDNLLTHWKHTKDIR